MNPIIEQSINIYRNMPLSRKIIMGALVLMVIIAFIVLFLMTNKTNFQVAFSGLSGEDASQVIGKLKEQRVPYKLKEKGTAVLVPEEQVYEVRLMLAASGLPKGGGVGYEIFDKTDFGTTDFVQKLNRQRALQGELARTIREFDEVIDAKVMIVMPKDSVFIEETKPPSASVLLRLKSDLDEEKVHAIVHLVTMSIEDLDVSNLSVVDTTGRVLFKEKTEEEKAEIFENKLANTQLKYKTHFERTLTSRIQTMLERVVGKDKAVVSLTSEMDFSRVDMSEEIYDPDERNTTYVRSRKNLASDVEKKVIPLEGEPSSVNPVVPPGDDGKSQVVEKSKKQNDTVNYELSKTTRHTIKPIAVLRRLSVAAVIDGSYSYEVDDNGVKKRKFVPRTEAEMERFRNVVKNAMGFNDARGDQATVESFQFSAIEDELVAGVEEFNVKKFARDNARFMGNLVLLVLLFLLIVRPIINTVKEIKSSVEEPEMPSEEDEEEAARLLEAEELEALTEAEEMTVNERAAYYAQEDVDKSANIIKGWLNEEEERGEEGNG